MKLCRYGRHPVTEDSTYRGRCRRCKADNSKRYRAEGRQHEWESPDRKKKAYWANREKMLSEGRARYWANKEKVAKQRRINRLRKLTNITEAEFQHMTELIKQVSAIPTISSAVLPPHPKVRFVRNR